MAVLFYSLFREEAEWKVMEVTERDGDTLVGFVNGASVLADKTEWFGVYADEGEALAGAERIRRRVDVVSCNSIG